MTSNHFGGDRVSGGVYWSRKNKEFISVPSEGGRLGGCESDIYVKTPIWMVLLAGPLMGIAFAFFLPLSGLLVLVPILASKLRGAAAPGVAGIAASQLQPGLSYLEGRAPTVAATAGVQVGKDSRLIELAEAIAERRMRDLIAQEGPR